jgi:hypothetical protein
MIEPGKVIHVGMGDKDVRQAHQLARRQHADVTEIEKQRPPFVAKIDIQGRVAERVVDEPSFEEVRMDFITAERELPLVSIARKALWQLSAVASCEPASPISTK